MNIGTIIWLAGLIATVWVIYDIFTAQKNMKTLHKVLWIVGALLFTWIAAIVYYFVVKKK